MAVRPPSDRRFRRARVAPARRHRSWLTNWRLVLRVGVVMGLALYAGYRGASWLFSADVLVVERVDLTGHRNLSRGEVEALLEGIHGQRMLTIDLDTWRLRLLGSPWVADVAIRRRLPGTVVVAITERQPIGIARLGVEVFLIDRAGAIIDTYGPKYADLDLPLVAGLRARPAGHPLAIDPDRAALAVAVVDELSERPALLAQVSEIDVADLRDAALQLNDDTTVVRLGNTDFVRRLEQYLELEPTLRARVPDLESVDVRFDARVYVRPRLAEGRRLDRRGEGSVQD
jgi:cell division protein FtsQ